MFYSRLSYNTNGWTSPSGPQGKSTYYKAHEFRYGFGFEEWLFNESFVEYGWHYGYIEGIHHGKNKNALQNNHLLRLFTIKNAGQPNSDRFLVAEIGAYDWEMISPLDSTNFINNHVDLINQMRQDIINLNNPGAINKFNTHLNNQDEYQLFNVKYRNLKLNFETNIRPDEIYRYNRFQLNEAD